MSQKSGFLIVLNGVFFLNVGHTLTKNYSGTYWPLVLSAGELTVAGIFALHLSDEILE